MTEVEEGIVALKDATIALRKATEELNKENRRAYTLSQELELVATKADIVAEELRALRQEVGIAVSIKDRDELKRHNAGLRCFLYLFDNEEKGVILARAQKYKDKEVINLMKEIK